jgi:MFS family permease
VALPRMMQIGFALAGLAHLGVATPMPWPVTATLFVLVGFGFFAIQNCMLALMSDLVPEARGSAVAMLLFAVFNGQSLGPVLWGILAEHRSYAACFLVSGLALLAMSALAMPALRRNDLPRTAR